MTRLSGLSGTSHVGGGPGRADVRGGKGDLRQVGMLPVEGVSLHGERRGVRAADALGRIGPGDTQQIYGSITPDPLSFRLGLAVALARPTNSATSSSISTRCSGWPVQIIREVGSPARIMEALRSSIAMPRGDGCDAIATARTRCSPERSSHQDCSCSSVMS